MLSEKAAASPEAWRCLSFSPNTIPAILLSRKVVNPSFNLQLKTYNRVGM
jgi:hypothetical protein